MNQPEFVDIPAKTYMSEQEFIAHMDELIPTPSVETNNNLLDLANSLWWEMKDDLYHAFSFVSRHFTPETLQSVYDLCGVRRAGLLPWEIIGAAIYSQTGTPPETISTDELRGFVLLPEPETANTVSTLATCTVRENGQETLFYTLHFGQIEPQKLLDTATAKARESGTTVTEALQQTDYDLPEVESHVRVNRAILGPSSKLAEKLSLLMASSPVTAAHITMDADSGCAAVEVNPLWEQLHHEREASLPVRQMSHKRERAAHRKEPDR